MAIVLSCAVAGAVGVGKSTFLTMIGGPRVEVLLEGPGLGSRTVVVNIEEINASHDEKMGGSGCGACTIGAKNFVILMFDVTSRMSYKVIPNYYRDVVRSASETNCYVVLVANKVDHDDRKVKTRHIFFHRKKNLSLVQSSALLGYGVSHALWRGMRPRLARDLFRMGTDQAVTLILIRQRAHPECPLTNLPKDIVKMIAILLRRDLSSWENSVLGCLYSIPNMPPGRLDELPRERWEALERELEDSNTVPVPYDEDDDEF